MKPICELSYINDNCFPEILNQKPNNQKGQHISDRLVFVKPIDNLKF